MLAYINKVNRESIISSVIPNRFPLKNNAKPSKIRPELKGLMNSKKCCSRLLTPKSNSDIYIIYDFIQNKTKASRKNPILVDFKFVSFFTFSHSIFSCRVIFIVKVKSNGLTNIYYINFLLIQQYVTMLNFILFFFKYPVYTRFVILLSPKLLVILTMVIYTRF